MNINDFWSWFETLDLGLRMISFRKIFQHLDSLPGAVVIVETGCARQKDNWSGDGQSTVLFDRYVNQRDSQSRVYSVDIDPAAVSMCQQLVSTRVNLSCMDSVKWLWNLSNQIADPVALLYLDSYDVDFSYTWPAAAHHLKELTAAAKLISQETLVVVDDAPVAAWIIPQEHDKVIWSSEAVGGKGRLVAEYADAVGAKKEFAYYQVGWTGLKQ